MTRFQVRKKLRKAGSRAKSIAVERLGNLEQGTSRLSINKASLKLATMKSFIRLFACGTTTVIGMSIVAGSAHATSFTLTSPTSGGAVASGISPVGGIVLDLIGLNDARVTSQLAANKTFVGYYNGGTPSAYNGNPGTIGIQTGFDSTVTNALGGGLKQAAIRFTLYDGDTAAGDFDFNDNTLLVNGLNFGNWSSVNSQNTDANGNAGSADFSGGGFRNDTLDTGWFSSSDAALLASFYNSVVNTQQVVYQVNDVDPYDNYYDFTQGISSNFTSVGQGPTVQPPSNAVPEPFTILGSLTAGGIGVALRRKRQQQEKETAKV